VTIKDIAEIANVSVATVSRVINNKSKGVSDETRKRILGLIKQYNYQPSAVARGLATKKSKIIGLIIADITNPFYHRLVKGVEDEAHEKGYNLILCDGNNSEEKEASYLDFLNEHYVSGIIYNNFHNISKPILNKVLNSSVPFVSIDSRLDVPGCKCVYLDNEKAMYELIQYLIDMGHKRIGFITGPIDSYSTEERYKGYLKALKDNQIEIDGRLIIEADYVIQEGFNGMNILLERDTNMSAVACCNDLMAIGAMESLKEKNIKIPGEMSLVGFDNIDMSRLVTPKLTTIAQPIYEMGREAAKIIIDTIEGKLESSYTNKVFVPNLIIRDSVKKIK